MLRECHVYKPPMAVVQSTLKWAFADLEEAAMRQTAFSLLKVRRAANATRVSHLASLHWLLTIASPRFLFETLFLGCSPCRHSAKPRYVTAHHLSYPNFKPSPQP